MSILFNEDKSSDNNNRPNVRRYIHVHELLALVIATACDYKETVTVIENKTFATDGVMECNEFDTYTRPVGHTEFDVCIAPSSDLTARFFKFIAGTSDNATVSNEVNRIFNNVCSGAFYRLLEVVSVYDSHEHVDAYMLVLDKQKHYYGEKPEVPSAEHVKALLDFYRLCREIVIECTGYVDKRAQVLSCKVVFKNQALVINMGVLLRDKAPSTLESTGIHFNMLEHQEKALQEALKNKDPRIVAMFKGSLTLS